MYKVRPTNRTTNKKRILYNMDIILKIYYNRISFKYKLNKLLLRDFSNLIISCNVVHFEYKVSKKEDVKLLYTPATRKGQR